MDETPASIAPVLHHAPGRGSQVTPAERREIQLAHLRDGLNQTELAAKFGRKRETIARCLQGEDFRQLRQGLEAELKESALATLKHGVHDAAKGWIKAISKAADRGDHKPSKDLLLHTGVIEPLGDRGAQGALVLVGVRVNINGQQVDTWQDHSGRVYDEAELHEHTGTIVRIGMGSGVPAMTPPSPEQLGACATNQPQPDAPKP